MYVCVEERDKERSEREQELHSSVIICDLTPNVQRLLITSEISANTIKLKNLKKEKEGVKSKEKNKYVKDVTD